MLFTHRHCKRVPFISLINVYYTSINYMTACVNVYIHLIDKCVLLYNYQCGHSFH